MTARSVMVRWMTPRPATESEHSLTIFNEPSLVTCSILAITRFAPCTRSIAPPIPFAIFPGIIQLARCEEEMSFPGSADRLLVLTMPPDGPRPGQESHEPATNDQRSVPRSWLGRRPR